MTVKIQLREVEYEVRAGMTLLSALKKIEVQPESVIAVRNGELLTEDEILREGDQIKLVAVISGGRSIHHKESDEPGAGQGRAYR